MQEHGEVALIRNCISELREDIEAIKRALAALRISVGPSFGNQWLAIPEAPKRRDEDGE